MRLIDSDALLEFLTNRYEGLEDSTGKWRTYGCYWDAKDAIKDAPTVDAVCVVRCEDCIYSSYARGGIFECCKHSKVRESKFGISTMFLERHERGFYCADGERRENDA